MEEQEIPIKWEVVGYGDNKIARCYYRHSRYAENPIQEGKWYKDFPMPKTYILKFNEIVDDETREEISSALNPEWTSFTPFNDKILLMGNPQENVPFPGTVLEIKYDLANFFKYTDRKPYSFPSQGNIALYDIEVEFDEEFPNPLTRGNRINMISMIKMVGGTPVCYFLHLYKINKLNNDEYPMKIVDLTYDHEKDLIITFFELLSGVDYVFSYNGDSFDMPYILTRAQIYYLKINIDNNIIIPKIESRYLG